MGEEILVVSFTGYVLIPIDSTHFICCRCELEYNFGDDGAGLAVATYYGKLARLIVDKTQVASIP